MSFEPLSIEVLSLSDIIKIMTIVIGLICKNGIVLACDSQVEFHRAAPVKRINANKVHRLFKEKNVAVAGAGTLTFINKAINLLRRSIREREEERKEKLSFLEIIDVAEVVMSTLHKVYNIQRLTYIYERPIESLMHAFPLMLGSTEGDNKYLFILHEDGVAEDVEDYATLGSGAAYAEYLLSKLYDKNLTTDNGKKIAIYVINEVGKIDPNVGGPINVVIIQDNEIKEMERKEINEIVDRLDKIEREVIPLLKSSLMGVEDEKKKR